MEFVYNNKRKHKYCNVTLISSVFILQNSCGVAHSIVRYLEFWFPDFRKEEGVRDYSMFRGYLEMRCMNQWPFSYTSYHHDFSTIPTID